MIDPALKYQQLLNIFGSSDLVVKLCEEVVNSTTELNIIRYYNQIKNYALTV
jgi:hypothetical protein